MQLSFTPTLDKEEAVRRLEGLLLSGPLDDAAVSRRIDRLSRAFRRYASYYPLPMWAPGIVVTNEMRGLSEALFPISEISSAFDLVLGRGCRFTPLLSGSYLHSSPSWVDFLQRFRPQLRHADPSATLRVIARDGEKRRDLLFALMLPHHFGGAFDRYPLQSRWLGTWLKENLQRLKGRIRVLDSACGSGEGTYGVVELLRAAGYRGEGSLVHGSTLEEMELFAAAHAFFPHDAARERAYRYKVRGLLDGPERVPMEFYLDDVASADGKGSYDLILCNGLLGGPLMHGRRELAQAVAALAARLAPGGVLLAADRFHEGWKLRVPAGLLGALFERHGLTPLELPEGVGGVRG